MERWAGKVALVTGASAGIGAAICVRLADAGLRVVGLARRVALIDELQSQVKGSGRIYSRQCNVSKPEEIAAAFQWVSEEFGGVDVMVNNAGVFSSGNITDMNDREISDDDLNSLIDVNVRAGMLCVRRAVRSMKARGVAGHIINISSIAGQYVPFSSEFNVYGSTKHATTVFSASLLSELAHLSSDIRVTNVSPGLTDTAIVGAARELKLPMLKPSDIADAVVYALGTPPTVNINEITITPVGEKRM